MCTRRHPVSFSVSGSTVRGTLYLPEGAQPAPCVVLAHGFSATMDWLVPRFAERFSAAGIAALIFDYRHLGRSEGAPRQLVDVERQREDLRAAIAFARSQPGIDASRMALWGASLGGSHAAVVAAEDPSIAAVVLNAPALGALGGSVRSPWATLWLAVVAIADRVLGLLGLGPLYLAVYRREGRAVFTDPELAQRFERLERGSATWQNRVAARSLFARRGDAERALARIAAPVLVCVEEPQRAERWLAKARRAEVRTYPPGHFDPHPAGPAQAVGDQLAFLRLVLLGCMRRRREPAPAEG